MEWGRGRFPACVCIPDGDPPATTKLISLPTLSRPRPIARIPGTKGLMGLGEEGPPLLWLLGGL